jgi:hypothetical protein
LMSAAFTATAVLSISFIRILVLANVYRTSSICHGDCRRSSALSTGVHILINVLAPWCFEHMHGDRQSSSKAYMIGHRDTQPQKPLTHSSTKKSSFGEYLAFHLFPLISCKFCQPPCY